VVRQNCLRIVVESLNFTLGLHAIRLVHARPLNWPNREDRKYPRFRGQSTYQLRMITNPLTDSVGELGYATHTKIKQKEGGI